MNPYATKLSVIVPIYNCEKYLNCCIDSILNQTYKPLEIILVDDGSTDSSSKICDLYSTNHENIIVIHKANEGLCRARRDGMRAATSEYVTFVDSDDWIDPDMYKVLIEQMIEADADIITSGYERDNGGQQFIDELEPGIYEGDRKVNYLHKNLIFDVTSNHGTIIQTMCTKIFRKSILEPHINNVPQDIHYLEDLAYTFTPFIDADRVIITHDVFYHYRITQGSMSTTLKDNYYDMIMYSLKVCRDIYAKYTDDILISFDLALLYNLYMYLLKLCTYGDNQCANKKSIIQRLRDVSESPLFRSACSEALGFVSTRNEKAVLTAAYNRHPRMARLYCLFHIKKRESRLWFGRIVRSLIGQAMMDKLRGR